MRWYNLLVLSVFIFLIAGCGTATNEDKSEMTESEVNEVINEYELIHGCGIYMGPGGNRAYIKIEHDRDDKHIKGVLFGKNQKEPVWSANFTGTIASANPQHFEIDVYYDIDGERIMVKETWKKTDDHYYQLIKADAARPDLPGEYQDANCDLDIPEKESYVNYYLQSSHIPDTVIYYQAVDVNGAVIIKLVYQEGDPLVTGEILRKVDREVWHGLVAGNCINGKMDSLDIAVEFREEGEYLKSYQTWTVNEEFLSLTIHYRENDYMPGSKFKVIELPNGFPDLKTFEENYMEYNNSID